MINKRKNEENKQPDNSEMLKNALDDRYNYYLEIEERQRLEQKRLEADLEWEDMKRRKIMDIEDQISALEASNKFYRNKVLSLYNQSADENKQEIEYLNEKIEDNEHSVTKLRIETDEVRIKKRPE